MSSNPFTNVQIIMAEDDDGHARLTEKNLKRAGITNPVIRFSNGRDTLDYIFGSGDGIPAHTENLLILLDLNMPVLDGYEVLRALKSDERTRHMPVIVLTTTDDSREIQRCYELGCNIYITKPVDYEAFSNAIRELGLFLSVVQLPKKS